ncbi:MAG: DNA polymerase II [Acidobacteriota bacterium]
MTADGPPGPAAGLGYARGMPDLGFVLQPTYRVVQGRAVVHLYGVLEGGETFLVRDDRQVPCFYVRTEHGERAAKLGAPELSPTDLQTLDGHTATRITVPVPTDIPALRDRLTSHGVPVYEADVRFPRRYLIDRGIRGSLSLSGEWRPGRGVDRDYLNPGVEPADWSPRLSVLSIDIETDPTASRLLSIALFGPGVAEVLLLRPENSPAPAGAVRFIRERDLLTALVRRVRAIDPDVITGWNVVDFDLRVLDQLAKQHGVRLDLGRGPGALRLRRSQGPRGGLEASLPGRVVLDGIQLLRGAFVRMDSYALGAVAKEVLGEGKLIEGQDRGAQILEAWEHDPELLVAYNLADARLVLDILDKLQLIELSVQRSRLTGLPIDRVAGSIAAFDFLYLTELGRRGVVAPSVGSGGAGGSGDAGLGGHVLEPVPGLWPNVLVFDFKSLYPSLMRTFHIDPLGHLPRPRPEDDAIVAPNGAAFSREPGILTGILDALFPRREDAKKAGDDVASHAIKILMNSFYGVLGTSACRFYRPELAGAITAWGREILLWTQERIETVHGLRVLYGDTDSLFVLSGEDDPAAALRLGAELRRTLEGEIAAHISQTWGVESRLELELEKLYVQVLLMATRGGRGGARKRYAGLRVDAGAPAEKAPEGEVELVGLEAVRRDWTDLAKGVQRELYDRLFHGRDLEAYLRRVVTGVRAGEHDSELVYRKALRKPLEDYTATTPPHVAAARKSKKRRRRLISYVVTTAGPEPADERQHPLDHEHYVQKQLRPVAEPVLSVLDLEFDRVVGDDAQLRLW